MNYYSEKDIRDIVAGVLAQSKLTAADCCAEPPEPIPVEVSARHVHLTQEALEKLFGKGYQLTKKKELQIPTSIDRIVTVLGCMLKCAKPFARMYPAGRIM